MIASKATKLAAGKFLSIPCLILFSLVVVSAKECADTSVGCPLWSQSGQCAENPVYMVKKCRMSCGWCTPATPANSNAQKLTQHESYEDADANLEAIGFLVNMFIFSVIILVAIVFFLKAVWQLYRSAEIHNRSNPCIIRKSSSAFHGALAL